MTSGNFGLPCKQSQVVYVVNFVAKITGGSGFNFHIKKSLIAVYHLVYNFVAEGLQFRLPYFLGHICCRFHRGLKSSHHQVRLVCIVLLLVASFANRNVCLQLWYSSCPRWPNFAILAMSDCQFIVKCCCHWWRQQSRKDQLLSFRDIGARPSGLPIEVYVILWWLFVLYVSGLCVASFVH